MIDKPEKFRMYFLVMYNISEIQKGIQAGHAVEQYAHKYFDDPDYVYFVENDKTWIILNGGTSRTQYDINLQWLLDNKVKHATFSEPDMNFSLTAMCFLVPAKVFDKKTYPDYEIWLETLKPTAEHPDYDNVYNWREQYMDFVGGNDNLKMREFLKQFRLA